MRLIVLFFCLAVFKLHAQGLYVIKFRDKANSPFQVTQPQAFLSPRSIERRTQQKISIRAIDLPVNPSYLSQITRLGGRIIHTSRWLNAALVSTTRGETLSQILALSFVAGMETQGDIRTGGKLEEACSLVEITNQNEAQLTQLGVDKMLKENLTGKGKWIGVFDSGFSQVNQTDAFKTAFSENRILFTRDLVDNETDVYNDDSHGAQVLSLMAGSLPGTFMGTAPGASYLLFRTEDVFSETKLEEWNWLIAAEIADSIGVDIINSSLGYTTFDTPAQNYVYADMNGQKALITRAADWAAGAGILVVTSAGNEGRNAWRYISAPADGDSVISVGAVTNSGTLATFSSVGPTATGTIKPELVAMGQSTVLVSPGNLIRTSNGTSFSSPLLAGMAASIWQRFPELTAMQIRRLMIESGSLAKSPNNQLGFGIPHWDRILEAATKEVVTSTTESILDLRSWYEAQFDGTIEVETSLYQVNGQRIQTFNRHLPDWNLVVDFLKNQPVSTILEVKGASGLVRRHVFIP